MAQAEAQLGEYQEAWGEVFIVIANGLAQTIGGFKSFAELIKDQTRRLKDFFGLSEGVGVTADVKTGITESLKGSTSDYREKEIAVLNEKIKKITNENKSLYESGKVFGKTKLKYNENARLLGIYKEMVITLKNYKEPEDIKSTTEHFELMSASVGELESQLEKLKEAQKGLVPDTKPYIENLKEQNSIEKRLSKDKKESIEYTSGLMGKLKRQMDELQKLDPVNKEGWSDLISKIKKVQEEMDKLQNQTLLITPEEKIIAEKMQTRTSKFRPNISPYSIEESNKTMATQTGALVGYKDEAQNQKDELTTRAEQAKEELPELYDQLREQLVGGLGEVSSIVTDLLGGAESSAGRIVNAFSRAVNTVNQIYNLFQTIKATIEAINTAKSVVDIAGSVLGLAGGGSFIVPAGFSQDNYPLVPGISAQSGELVTVTPKSQVGNQNKQLLMAVNGLARNIAINGRPIVNINTEMDWLKVTQKKITPAQQLNDRTRSNEIHNL
jgi:hypothetical protein